MYLVVLDPIMRSLCEGREPGDLLFEQPGREGTGFACGSR